MEREVSKVGKASYGKFGLQTIYGYFSQIWVWRFRVHVFWVGEKGEAFHDHPWGFTSIPLSSYVEEILDPVSATSRMNVVRAFKLNKRPATHIHRYVGKWSGRGFGIVPGAVVTLAYVSGEQRNWRYWRLHKGEARSFPWKPYLRRITNKPPKS